MKRLMYVFIIGFLFGQATRCSSSQGDVDQKHFTGDLFFKLISIGSFYQADSLTIKKINHYLDSLKTIHVDSLTSTDKETLTIFDGLKKNELIQKPFFTMRIDSATTYLVYTDTSEYKKIKNFKHQELINENKKVKIELTGKIVNLGPLSVIDCATIDHVEKVDGRTFWRK